MAGARYSDLSVHCLVPTWFEPQALQFKAQNFAGSETKSHMLQSGLRNSKVVLVARSSSSVFNAVIAWQKMLTPTHTHTHTHVL